ncbi:hypothetical protein DA102_035800 [Sinorhizobium meliloti]|nr:hypothetical protein DA102_035800 [Sinorhizobium meliloti]
MRPVAGRRTRSRAVGPGAEHGLQHHTISAQCRPTSSTQSARSSSKAAALVMPWCDTYAMTQHLAEIARHIDDDAHAILIMDQAGWHMSNNLVVPENITILPLPPKSPEVNPVENLWNFMRDNWLSNRVFRSYDDIVDHCCDAWRKLESQPWRIISIGRKEWANEF